MNLMVDEVQQRALAKWKALWDFLGASKLRALFLMGAYAGGFSGFYFLLLALFASDLGYLHRSFTVPYRAAFLGFSVLLISYGVLKRSFVRLGWLWVPILFFWLPYFIRIAFDCYFFPKPLGVEPSEYVKKTLGMTLIPMFIFLIDMNTRDNILAFRAFWTVHVGTLFLSLLLYGNTLGTSYRDLYFEAVNTTMMMPPIMLAYIGVVAAVISFQLLLMDDPLERKAPSILLGLTMIGGMALVASSATRSALFAVVTAMLVTLIMSSHKIYSSRQILRILAVFIVSGAFLFVLIEKIGGNMISRIDLAIERARDFEPSLGGGRLRIYQDSTEQLLRSPLLGSGLVERFTRSYPHNHFLEAFMATGILGGVSFIVLIWVALKKSFLILREKGAYGWIACLFIVYFIHGMFSSSIMNPFLWYSMMAVYSVKIS